MSAPTFADKLHAALMAKREALGGTIPRPIWNVVVNAVAHAEGISKKRKPKGAARGRNPLFDALAAAMGTQNLEQMTRNAAKAVGVALADIVDVSPDLTVEEIERRAAAYKRRWPDPRNWSPMALAKHWHEFGQGDRTKASREDIYQAPEGWQRIMVAMYGEGAATQIAGGRGWLDFGPDTRKEVLAKINKGAQL